MKPIYIHSGMTGAPQSDGNINAILEACLVNGFNTKTATSASASGGVLTLNFASDPGFEALQTVEIAVSSVALVNGRHRVVANSNNQVTIAIDGLVDGAVGSSGAGITIRQAGAGWSKPFSNSTVSVFRSPAGNRRYLRCEHTGDSRLMARGYVEMTNTDDNGINPFPVALASNKAVNNLSSGSKWYVVVTDKWFLISFSTNDVGNIMAGTLIFGDLANLINPNDIYATVLIGQSGSYICRGIGNSGNSIGCEFFVPGSSADYSSNPDLNNKTLVPYALVRDFENQLRGVLPNIYGLIPAVSESEFLNAYSNISNFSGRAKPFKFTYSGAFLFAAVSLDEEVWI